MVKKKEGGAKTFSKVGDVDGGPAPKGNGTAAISVYCCSVCWTEENAAYCPVQFRVVRATPAEDAREKRPADLEVPMNLPYLAGLDPDNATFVILRNSGVHTGSNAKAREEQRQADGRLTWLRASKEDDEGEQGQGDGDKDEDKDEDED